MTASRTGGATPQHEASAVEIAAVEASLAKQAAAVRRLTARLDAYGLGDRVGIVRCSLDGAQIVHVTLELDRNADPPPADRLAEALDGVAYRFLY